jgi:hypothetical protein
MVILLLAFELSFIAVLGGLLSQAEASAARQERARAVTSKAGRMLLILYDVSSSVGLFDLATEPHNAGAVAISTDEMPVLTGWLKTELKDRPDAQLLLERISENSSICLPSLQSIEKSHAAKEDDKARQEWDRCRPEIQPKVNQVVADINSLIKIGEQMESEGPERERRDRQQTKKVLFAGLLINVFVVLLIAFIFAPLEPGDTAINVDYDSVVSSDNISGTLDIGAHNFCGL